MLRGFLCVLLFLLLASPACAELKVVATLPWIGGLAKDIGKDKVKIKLLVKPSQDPHYVEAKPSMILAVRRADILMYNGLNLEAGYLPVLVESSRNSKVQPGMSGNLDCSRFVEVIGKEGKADRSMGDVHPQGNPHYHFSPKNILRVAEGIATTFAYADSENGGFYRANLDSFKERLKGKETEWSAASLKGKKFVAFHKLFEYLADDFGFEIVGYIEPKAGIPPSTGHLQRLIRVINEESPDAIITTTYYGRKEAGWISKKTSIKSIQVPHDVGALTKGTEDWFSFMDRVLETIK